MWYMDGMNRQYEAVLQELQEVRQQLTQVREPSAKYIMQVYGCSAKSSGRVVMIEYSSVSLGKWSTKGIIKCAGILAGEDQRNAFRYKAEH